VEHPYECEIEELGHTAEVGLRVRADTPEALFACAARAMFDLLGATPGPERRRQTIQVEALDPESLLVDWLSEILYLYEARGEVYDRFEIRHWSPTRLEALVEGGSPPNGATTAIKAVTYHGLRVFEEAGRWTAEFYFDV